VYYGGADSQAAPMVKQMRQLGVKATADGRRDGSHADLPVRSRATRRMARWLRWPACRWKKMPGGKELYREVQEARFNEDPCKRTRRTRYDGAMAMFKAMKKANSTDPAKYLPFLAKTRYAGCDVGSISEYDA
jgi:branched-chain amino acid transport system substrate-binding protein